MGKHATSNQKWAYSAEQIAAALQNPEKKRYKQGVIDALRAVARVEDGKLTVNALQELLDGLPNMWDQTIESAYVTGFSDMYGLIAESLSIEYAPEAQKHQSEDTSRPAAPERAPKSA